MGDYSALSSNWTEGRMIKPNEPKVLTRKSSAEAFARAMSSVRALKTRKNKWIYLYVSKNHIQLAYWIEDVYVHKKGETGFLFIFLEKSLNKQEIAQTSVSKVKIDAKKYSNAKTSIKKDSKEEELT